MGGGLIGVLIFLRDKMDIVITSCRFCDAKICGNCQSILNGEPLCSACFESPARRKKGLLNFKKERQESMWAMVQKLNFILPGFAQLFSGKLLIGLVMSFFFWFALLTWWNGAGFLWNNIFFYENSFTMAVAWMFLLLALVVYFISCGFSIAHVPRGTK